MTGSQPMRDMVALVTGASGGLGSAIARALAAEGCAVVVHYRSRAASAEALAADIVAQGGRASLFAADLTDESSARALVQHALDQFGRLDVLVNNAGWTRIVDQADLAGLTDDVITRTLALKVHAPLYLIRAAEAALKASPNGNIVNITSVAGIAARGSSMIYAAANAALSTLTRTLARSLAPQVRVNAVAPGYVQTGFGRPADGVAAAIVARNNHLGRIATPEDVASAVVYLCAHARVVTGEEFAVDAGIARLGKR